MSTRSAHRRTYEANFKDAADRINEALQRSLPTSTARSYDKVALLSLTWDNDDLGIKDLENDLIKVFRKSFNFTVEQYSIPNKPKSSNLVTEFQDALFDFRRKWAGDKSLLIFYYSGHAITDPTGQESIWR